MYSSCKAEYLHILATSKINEIFSFASSKHSESVSFKYFTSLLTDPAIAMRCKKELTRSLMYCIEMCNKGTK
jgi:hypothetical protein